MTHLAESISLYGLGRSRYEPKRHLLDVFPLRDARRFRLLDKLGKIDRRQYRRWHAKFGRLGE